MGRAPSHKKTRYKAEKKEKLIICNRQFPDCPAEPNDNDCKICSLYKKQ